MQLLSFAHREKLRTRNAIALVWGRRVDGVRVWAYLEMTGEQAERYTQDIQSGKTSHFSDYGIVLREGEGKPDEEVRIYMEEIYGFVHQRENIDG